MLLRRLERAIPATGNHPVFKRDVRAIGWWLSVENLPHYTLRKLLHYLLLILMVWLLVYEINADSAEALFSDASGLLLVIVLSGMVLDFACLVLAVQSVRGEVNKSYWDLLRLTPLTKEGIVAAKLAATRLRVWKVMLFTVSVRGFIILLTGLYFWLFPETSWLHRLLPTGSTVQITFAIGAFLLIGLIVVIEPVWRMKAMTTVGVMLSAHFSHRLHFILLPPLLLSLIWLAQPLALLVLLTTVVFALMPIALIVYMVDIANTVFIFFAIMCLMTFWMIRYAYDTLHYVSMKRAVQHFDTLLEIES